MAYKGGIDKYTKLLIRSNTTDGSTVFEDLIGTHSISPTNNTQHDTAQTKFGSSSILFDGANDNLSIPDHADFAFGDGDFTIDFWVRFNSVSGPQVFFGQSTNGSDYMRMEFTGSAITFNASNTVFSFASKLSGAWSPSTGVWYHIALVRFGTRYNIYVNGTSIASGTDADTYPNYTNAFTIGESDQSAGDFNGWMDMFRISKGIARWSDDFTVPDQPYEIYDHALSSSDKLLLNFSGNNGDTSADDESDSNHTPTFNGNAKIAARKIRTHVPIFDGTGDYLTAPDHASWDVGTGAFAFEFFVRLRSVGSETGLGAIHTSANGIDFLLTSATNVRVFVAGTQHNWTVTTLVVSRWYHFALVRTGSTLTLYIDGVSQGDKTESGSISGSTGVKLGSRHDASSPMNGWLSAVRISNVVRYTGAFTPPTTAFTSDANTLLLIQGSDDIADINSTTILDEGVNTHTITANGNAKLAGPTAVGPGSLESDGTGDHISIADHADWDIGTGDCTFEGWVLWNGTSTPGSTTLLELASASELRVAIYDTGGTPGFHIYYDGTEYYTSHAYTPVPNRWYHFCGVRYGNKLYFYIDGAPNGDIEDVTGDDIQGSSGLRVNGALNGSGQVNGYIDGVRITKGLARFTEAFEVPAGYGSDDPNAGGVQGKLELIGGRV